MAHTTAINEGFKREIARVSAPDLNVNIIFVQQSKSNKKVNLNSFQYAVLFLLHTLIWNIRTISLCFTGPCSLKETQLKLIEELYKMSQKFPDIVEINTF